MRDFKVPSGTSAGLNDLRFVTATTGWAVGEWGSVLVTRDGGLNWSTQTSGTHSSLYGVFFVDEQTGWTVGENGSILATATGGR